MVCTVNVIRADFLIDTQTLICKWAFGLQTRQTIDRIHAVQSRSRAGRNFYACNVQFGRSNRIAEWHTERSCLNINAIHQLHEAEIVRNIETPRIWHFESQARSGQLNAFYPGSVDRGA